VGETTRAARLLLLTGQKALGALRARWPSHSQVTAQFRREVGFLRIKEKRREFGWNRSTRKHENGDGEIKKRDDMRSYTAQNTGGELLKAREK